MQILPCFVSFVNITLLLFCCKFVFLLLISAHAICRLYLVPKYELPIKFFESDVFGGHLTLSDDLLIIYIHLCTDAAHSLFRK